MADVLAFDWATVVLVKLGEEPTSDPVSYPADHGLRIVVDEPGEPRPWFDQWEIKDFASRMTLHLGPAGGFIEGCRLYCAQQPIQRLLF